MAAVEPFHVKPDPLEFRSTMAEFASGVTVVTAHDDEGPVGFAAQSFSSVSLDPPMVLFCVDIRSRAWPRIRAAGHFCINILAEDQAELCERFGSGRGRKFEDLDVDRSVWGAPTLPEVLARIHAVVEDVHRAGDHEIVVGKVEQLERLREGEPMIFFRGRFGLEEEAHLAVDDLWAWRDGWL